MAKKRPTIQNTSEIETRSFQKGMNKDLNESLMAEGSYLNAINAVNNSVSGDLGIIGNEPSNKLCTTVTYTIIGTIHLYEDKWAILSTDDVNSEIGIFDETECSYKKIVNDPCLNFNKKFLAIGQAKENFDCTWQIYWADANNPDRSMNMDNPPFIQECSPTDPTDPTCITCINTTALNCEEIRLAKLTTPACLKIEQGPNGGSIFNGTYQAVIAYTQNEQRVTDFCIPSIPVSLFDHRNLNGSLDVIIEEIDTRYEEFELVIISVVNMQTVANSMGIYSTRQNRISIDRINPAVNVTVPLRLIPLDRPSYEKSEAIYRNGDYLIRVAPTTRFSFNYQPLANDIKVEWIAVEYPPEYYRKAGLNTSYLRDEQYAFFVRWIWNTDDNSESYHIPGRAPIPTDFDIVNNATQSEPETDAGITPYRWRVQNTATGPFLTPTVADTDDGGDVISKGQMGYWESTELYPDDKPDVWGDLCGKPIRHHKMPDNEIINHFNQVNKKIIVLGVQFSNINPPLDNNGNIIEGIIGYEILRGSREGNKTVIAKGLLNNMGEYDRDETGNNPLPTYYQNYPYNDLRNDPFLSNTWLDGDVFNNNSTSLGGDALYSKRLFTFHSPDTQFRHPFLSSQELKIYETLHGVVTQKFVEAYDHPEHKLMTNFSFLLSAIIGFGIAYIAIRGDNKRIRTMPTEAAPPGEILGLGTGGTIVSEGLGKVALVTMNTAIVASETASDLAIEKQLKLLLDGGTLVNPSEALIAGYKNTAQAISSVSTSTYTEEYYPVTKTGLPSLVRFPMAIPMFMNYWGEGTDTTLEVLRTMSRYRQYAYQAQSHCFHDLKNTDRSGTRTVIRNASYLYDGLTEMSTGAYNILQPPTVSINNLFRSTCVSLITSTDLAHPTEIDTSRVLMSDIFSGDSVKEIIKGYLGSEFQEIANGDKIKASAHYVGIKTRLQNQYGQVDGVMQVPTGCIQKFKPDPLQPGKYKSDIIFGGGTYIGRYTEKNTMFYFTDWLYNTPNGIEFDYRLRKMMPFPTYWMDSNIFDLNTFFQGVKNWLSALVSNSGAPPPDVVPSDFHNFDMVTISNGISLSLEFVIKYAAMYLFNSGVRDFYVESEINVEYRDWENDTESRHYDPYGYKDYSEMFRADRVKYPNLYKYDFSLSVERLYQNFATWAVTQRRNYDPILAETCYSYYPKRLIYSLPQSLELRFDNWSQYLVNNYKDFTSKLTVMKPIAKNGAIMLFENEAPITFAGTDQLETTAGTKITIGDGGLFNQALQNIVNAETPYEYASCQNRNSVINTPAGLFWISRNQGKIFHYTGKLDDISQQGMKWWFEEFLPYKILEDFPNFELLENGVIGVDCQAIYNNNDGIVYFTKRDFRIKDKFRSRVTYKGADNFMVDRTPIKLGDALYFDDASWTVSYDPKAGAWVSFHDWHPNLLLPGKNTHMTILDDGIWLHNDTSDSYCNFYGIDYPFEVDMALPTGQSVNTLKSVEYLMEVYNWDRYEVDKYHVLDFNFDKAIVYNTEQVSGVLNLNLSPKNNAPMINNYPQVNPASMDILYSKVEQKYRFNQFWDITDDRGEFTNARRSIWITQPNGYIKDLNTLNLNYAKPQHQRKSFRHYQANLKLRREVSGNNNMQLKLVNVKNQYSMR